MNLQFPRSLLPVLLLLTLMQTLLSACNPRNEEKTVVVGSKDFTEQFILGEMYAQLLENSGYRVTRRLNLGGTPVIQEALKNGQIDLYPEYTGTALLTVLKRPPNSDPEQVYAIVAREYQEQFNLAWLDPAPMNNTQALAMTREGSQAFGIRTISDMVAQSGNLVMAGPPEFREREDGLPGIMEAYGGFELKGYRDIDPGLRYQALTSGQADVVVAFGTDGEISAFNLVVLEDDRSLFPPYQVAPVVRQQILDRYPEIRDTLNRLAPKLTNETMQRLNYEVSGNRREPAEVANEFLIQEGFLEATSQ